MIKFLVKMPENIIINKKTYLNSEIPSILRYVFLL